MAGAEPGPAPQVLLLARAPGAGAKRALVAELGEAGCARLQEALIARTTAWAASVAPKSSVLAVAGGDGDGGPAGSLPRARAAPFERARAAAAAGVRVVRQQDGPPGERLAAAVAEAVSGGGSVPGLLIASCDVPTLGPQHAGAALDDLADGCDASFGPAADGALYLLALADPETDLLARTLGPWPRRELMSRALQAAHDAGLRVGLLRSERALRTPADARALRADPLAPPDVLAALGGGIGPRP